MKRALLTFGVGTHAELLQIALPSFEKFAEKHGYTLITGAGERDRPPSWWKIPEILRRLEQFDEVLFIGADLVIIDPSRDLCVPRDAWQALVKHRTSDGEVPGADFWLVRAPMVPILERVWSMTHYRDHGWWEQAALMDLMGYSLERPVQLREPTELYERTFFLDKGWNVHKWEIDPVDHPRVMHATMWDNRAAIMREWADSCR